MLIAIETDDVKSLGIGYTELVIYEFLKTKTDQSGVAWISLQEIADAVSINKNQVFTALRNLQKKGHIYRGTSLPPSIKVKL